MTMHWEWSPGWGYMHGFGWLFFVMFWVLLVLGVIALVRRFSSPTGVSLTSPPKDKSALDILDERFARGEIDKEEFEEKRRILQKRD